MLSNFDPYISIGNCKSELIFGMSASFRILYKNMTSYPIISKNYFWDIITLGLYNRVWHTHSPARPGECQKCRASTNHWELARLASKILVAKKLFKLRNKHSVLQSFLPRKPLNINWLFLFYNVLDSELFNKLVLKGNIELRK